MSHNQFFVLAHNIRSTHNVGSFFRTADALGVSKIFLTGYTPAPDNVMSGSKISKVALGAENTVPWEAGKSATKVLKDLKLKYSKIQVVALENNLPKGMKAVPLQKFKPKFPLVLIVGEEVNGIEPRLLKLCDKIVEIPMHGQKESLNVSVAFGIAAFWISSGLTRFS